jgi:16S rRNA (guanine527-N7)-methyltransferase
MRLEPLGEGWKPRIERVLRSLAPERPRLEATSGLARLLDLVAIWNRRLDLTAARNADEAVDLFVADAVVLAERAQAGERWVDVGSGAGAPGIALALLAPELSLTLIEPRQKRVAFLRTALGVLGRDDLTVERKRVEELPSKRWDVAVSRATLPPAQWVVEGRRLAPRFWVLLARDPPPSVPSLVAAHDISYRWPLTSAERRALCYAETNLG